MPLSEKNWVVAKNWLDAWERRETSAALVGIPYLLLVVSVVLTVVEKSGSGKSLLLDLALAGLTAAWMLWMVALHPTRVERPRLVAVYFAVLVALMAVLVVRSPWFGFFSWTGYIIGFHVLRDRWRFAGFAAVAVVTATSQNGGLPQPNWAAMTTYAILILMNMLVVGIVLWFTANGHVQEERRNRALAELAEVNAQLEVMLQENADLHARLLTQARDAGILDERQRMAREIHDTLAQGFAGIITQLEAAKHIAQHPDQWRLHVDQAQLLARESLTEARRSVQALRPEALECARLPDAIADMARRWSKTSAVALSFETTGEARPLLPDVEVTLFRVAQETLTNVAKHASASRVGVTLSYLDDVVLLDVRDDGVGFTLGARQSDDSTYDGHGFGLSAMHQRLRQVGGRLEVESAPGEGASINACVPALPAAGSI